MLLAFACYSQQANIPFGTSLKASIQREKNDTLKIRLLQQLRQYYRYRFKITQDPANLDSAVNAIVTALALSRDDQFKFENIKLAAATYVWQGDTVKAKVLQQQAVEYYTRIKRPDLVIGTWLEFANAATGAYYNFLALRAALNAEKVLKQYPSAGDEVVIAYAVIRERYFLSEAGAENDVLEAIDRFKNKGKNLDRFYRLLSVKYRYAGDLKKALVYGLDGLKDMEAFKDTTDADWYYGELGLIYDELGDAEKSIYYYKQCLSYRERIPTTDEQVFRTAGFIVKNYLKLGKTRAALNEAIGLEKRYPPQSPLGKVFNAQNKAYCYDALKKFPEAEQQYLQIIAELDTLKKEYEFISYAYEDIANFYLRQKNLGKAKYYAEAASKVMPSLGKFKNNELLRYKIDSATGDYADALKHYVNYSTAKDSLFNESKSKEIAELQLKYETDKKEKDIQLLTKDSEQKRAQLNQAIIGIALLLLVLGMLFYSFRNNQKKSKEIDRQNIVLNDLLKEKEWLIKEVHHRVKNNLQIVMGLLQRQSAYIDNSVALAAIQNSEHRMHSIALIHQKLYQSEDFQLVSMPDYITEMIGYLQESFDLTARITFEKEVEQIDFEIATAVPLGLILNEAITNSIKYAFAGQEKGCIQIALYQTGEDSYTLRISDNGRGLPPDFDILKANSMGFNLIRGLSKQLSGKFKIENVQGVAMVIDFNT
jgi:two-component system, sensor histidine kinase PdtaS